MARCLVIGGGFLGGTVARALADREHQVIVFSRSFGSLLATEAEPSAGAPIVTVPGAIETGEPLSGLIDASELIFYFAGGSTPAAAAADAGASVELSVVPATTVLELMHSKSTRRIVLASSGGTVYGEPGRHPTPEDHPTNPIGIHGHNALTIERYASFYARRHGLEPVVLRIATGYGPGQRTRRGQGVVAAWIRAALDRAAIDVYGSLETRRDLVFGADVAEAAVRVAFAAAPGTYNVGSGGSHSLGDVLDLLGELAGRELEIRRHPARGVDVKRTELDCSRLADEAGWVPTTALADGLRRTWEMESEAARARASPVAGGAVGLTDRGG